MRLEGLTGEVAQYCEDHVALDGARSRTVDPAPGLVASGRVAGASCEEHTGCADHESPHDFGGCARGYNATAATASASATTTSSTTTSASSHTAATSASAAERAGSGCVSSADQRRQLL